jgi:hypothetical protein
MLAVAILCTPEVSFAYISFGCKLATLKKYSHTQRQPRKAIAYSHQDHFVVYVGAELEKLGMAVYF